MTTIALPGLYIDPSTKSVSLVLKFSLTQYLTMITTLSLTWDFDLSLGIQFSTPLVEGSGLLSPPSTFTIL